MVIFTRRMVGGIVLTITSAIALIKSAITIIGASTAPEDARLLAQVKWPAFVKWFWNTPDWTGPIALFLSFGLMIWLFWPTRDRRVPNEISPGAVTPTSNSADVKISEGKTSPATALQELPFAAGVLGNPIGGVFHAPLPPAPPRTDPQTEHPDKIKAKEAIIPLVEDYFEPAANALREFKILAKDRFLSRFENKSAVRSVCSRAIDYAPEKASTRKDPALAHELKNIDKIRTLNLFETETSLYHAYIDYGQKAYLAVDLVNQCEPMHESVVKELRDLYGAWRSAHDQFVDAQKAVRQTHRDLNTVGRLHLNVLQEIPVPNWDRVTIRPS